MLALPVFTARKRLSFCREETCRGHVLGKYDSGQEKSLPFQEGLCWRYLFSQLESDYRFAVKKHAGGMF